MNYSGVEVEKKRNLLDQLFYRFSGMMLYDLIKNCVAGLEEITFSYSPPLLIDLKKSPQAKGFNNGLYLGPTASFI